MWLILRPRTFQVLIGFRCFPTRSISLLSPRVGSPKQAPIVGPPARTGCPKQYADPVPQALVLTAIVISFATTALFLVVVLASRGLTGTDHVDGREPKLVTRLADHLMITPGGAAARRGSGHARIWRRAAPQHQCGDQPCLPVSRSVCDCGRAAPLAADAAPAGIAGVYRLGDWPAPFAIVLVADRLSALMLLLTSLVAAPACGVLIRALA